MSRQNSFEISSLEVTVENNQVNIDPIGNGTKPFDDVKVMLIHGPKGTGIASIEKTSSVGLVDTYTITYEDGRTDTFTVTNGSSDGEWLYTGTCDTARSTTAKTVTLTDSTHTPANGELYLITFTNGNSAKSMTLAVNGGTAKPVKYANSTSSMYGGLYVYGKGYLMLQYDSTNNCYVVVASSCPAQAISVNCAYKRPQVDSSQEFQYHGTTPLKWEINENVCKILQSNWSATRDENGYYTYNLTSNLSYLLSTIPTITGSVGDDLGATPPTEAQMKAYDCIVQPNGYVEHLNYTSFKLYAKEKPESDFYIRIMGYYAS